MSSPFRASLLVIACAALALPACDREERHSRAKPIGETVPAGQSPDTIWPGGEQQPALDPRAKLYDNNAQAINQGQTLYMQMNCVGCHFHGGGGMGPPLMDEQWIYGSAPENIFDSIVEGRPNGMPSFRGKIPDYKVWQLVSYVRSLGSLTTQASTPPRADTMSVTPPANLHSPKPAVSQPVDHP
jgi:cytochrome c oxidase cbb3-type subunit III